MAFEDDFFVKGEGSRCDICLLGGDGLRCLAAVGNAGHIGKVLTLRRSSRIEYDENMPLERFDHSRGQSSSSTSEPWIRPLAHLNHK
jgi:hypothetical protein